MKLHYIYYAPDFIQHDGTKGKVGCTRWLNRRLQVQNITNYQILETHTDENIAGKREKELQIEKNCVEKQVGIDYAQTLKWSSASPINKKGYKQTKEHRKNLSIAKTGHSVSKETREKMRKWALNRKRPECSVPGELNPNSKATEKQVIEIRKKYPLNGRIKNLKKIADEFNLSTSIVERIIKYKTWKHVK